MKTSEKVCIYCEFYEIQVINRYLEHVCIKNKKGVIINSPLYHTCNKWTKGGKKK